MGAFDYTTNGVTMPAHSCKTASGGVWLREDMREDIITLQNTSKHVTK